MRSIPEMAVIRVEQLAAFNDGTPLFLLGYSFGGFLAYGSRGGLRKGAPRRRGRAGGEPPRA